MLGGTNMELYRTIRKSLSANLVASGGVTTLDEIRELAKLGMNAAILGRAIYTGGIDLTEAIRAAGGAI
jgi:phosphoribosylformimino-5-aminoimidazole carboxamide ribotide isomerase